MASLANVSVRRPIATAMFYLVIITLGVMGFRYLPVDLLPPIEFPRLTVYVNYPNVGPEEMEEIITDPLENTLSGVPNVERMTSRSDEGGSRVSLEFAQGTNLDAAANDVRAELDRIRDDLPDEAEPPGIWKFDPNSQEIVTLAVRSQRDLEETTQVLEDEVARRFEQIPGVGTIEVRGGIYREIHVNLKRDRLQAIGLTAAEVQQALATENATLPGGNVRSGLKDLYVRTLGEYQSIDEIAETVITTAGGSPVRVEDVAEVVNGYEDINDLAELNGVPVVSLEIQKQSGANTVTVAQNIREEVERVNRDRDDMQLTVVGDQSEFIQKSINNVQSSALWGGLLAILVLYLFLRNGSTTFIISIAIPISIIATFGLLYFAGMTLNLMTFGGLALGVGMIVDNSVVVLENIVRQREENGRSLKESARVGTREVAGAVVASTLTTCVIFLPLVFMQATSASLLQALALVVVFALACSLLVALTVVPMLASNFLTVKPDTVQPGHQEAEGTEGEEAAPQKKKKGRFQIFFERVEGRYSRGLATALRHRRVVFGVTGVLLVGTLLLWPLLPVELAPPTDADEIDIDLEMAQGMNIAVSKTYLDELEAAVRPLLPMDQVDNIATEVRGGRAEVEVRLADAGERSVSSARLADEIREEIVGTIPGADIRVDAQTGLWILRRAFSSGGGGEDVEVQLRGYDLDEADALARRISSSMERVEGVEGVRVGRREGRPEQNFLLDRERIYSLGLSVQEVARAIQVNVGGSLAGQYRTGGEEYPIRVRLQPEDRLTVSDLDNIAITTPAGETIPVSAVTRTTEGRGPTEIRRINGQRVVYITANLESGVALGDAVDRIRAATSGMELPDGFTLIFGGAYEEQQEAQQDFLLSILMAIALIYMVMAGQFERFLDPLVVMLSVPFALVGVIPTLLLTGTSLNMQSLMGIVMLIGIVVNNAIVLVDYINLLRREHGLGLMEAVVEAGRLRLRPILITTLTTILGLFPLALGIGSGAELQAALARAVIGGLTASTLVTLVLIPVAYVTVDHVSERVKSTVGGWSWWAGKGGAAAVRPAQS